MIILLIIFFMILVLAELTKSQSKENPYENLYLTAYTG